MDWRDYREEHPFIFRGIDTGIKVHHSDGFIAITAFVDLHGKKGWEAVKRAGNIKASMREFFDKYFEENEG